MGYLRLVRPGLLATAAALVVMALLSVWAYGTLPERVPIHWNVSGEVDGWAGRTEAVVVMPLVMLGVAALLAVVPLVDPRRPNLERSAKPYQAVWVGTVVLLTAIHGAILLTAGTDTGVSGFPVPRLALALSGGLLLVVGNYLGKIRSNWFAGIRTPWTLSSERSWARTHRLGGRLFMLVGAVCVLSSLLFPVAVGLVVLMGGTIAIAVVLTAYSYRVWRDDPERTSSGTRAT